MPQQNIDYSKNCVYKLICKNPEIKDVYVGRTTDIIRRKATHKSNCNTNKQDDLYIFINNNGGWKNWEFVIIEEYPCENSSEASVRETHWIFELEATLNKHLGFNGQSLYSNTYKKEWYFKKRKELHEKQQKNKEYLLLEQALPFSSRSFYLANVENQKWQIK